MFETTNQQSSSTLSFRALLKACDGNVGTTDALPLHQAASNFTRSKCRESGPLLPGLAHSKTCFQPRPSKETKRPLVSTCFNNWVSAWFRTFLCASQSSATQSEELQYQPQKKKKDAPGSQHPLHENWLYRGAEIMQCSNAADWHKRHAPPWQNPCTTHIHATQEHRRGHSWAIQPPVLTGIPLPGSSRKAQKEVANVAWDRSIYIYIHSNSTLP